MSLIEQFCRVHHASAQNFIHLLFITVANVDSKLENIVSSAQNLFLSMIDTDLLLHLTTSLVRLSTNHTQIIANETGQLRHLLASHTLNDSVRVKKIVQF